MNFKIFSDLHIEFYDTTNLNKIKRNLERYFPQEESDKDTILLLAGDIGIYKNWDITYKPVFNYFSKRFKQVIAIPGNHSWYGSEIWDNEKEFLKDKQLPKNVLYGDNYSYLINDTIIIASCLWTDMNKENPLNMNYIQMRMNDYVKIKKSNDSDVYSPYKKCILAQDTIDRHKISKQFIIDELINANKNGIKNKIILSHHAPSYQSISNIYKSDSLNSAYCNDLDDIMIEYGVNLWCHGHIHTNLDYMIENTRVICNPFGYHNYQVNPEFDYKLKINID